MRFDPTRAPQLSGYYLTHNKWLEFAVAIHFRLALRNYRIAAKLYAYVHLASFANTGNRQVTLKSLTWRLHEC